MPLKEYQSTSYSDLHGLLDRIETQIADAEIFIFFSCTLDKHGDPTTKSCFESEDSLMEFTEFIRGSKRSLHLVYFRMRLEDYYVPNTEISRDPYLRVSEVPTLLKWKEIKTPPEDPTDIVWPAEHTAKVGELLLDISEQLAKTYGMGSDDIEKGLPLIDTSKTLIREVCPAFLSDVQCHAGKYRRHDGLCNNLDNPTWGAINTPFTRLMAPHFADGMNQPRESITGANLPIPRIVSRTIHPDEGYHDHAGTVMIVAWGQFMDHDFTLTATPLDRHTKNEPEECCNRPAHLKHPYCMDLIIPDDDYFYQKYGVKCQDFVRSFPAARPGCRLGSKVPFNTLTGVIDGNTVYGVTEAFSRHLRSGYSGLLRMNPVFSEFGLKELLPLKLDVPEEGCTRANGSEYCFEAGEIRVNEQLVLACMHTIMAREHNRIAKELAKINPHWDDETLYQEARRIVIAEIQHITFNEFLPIVLGKEVMEKFGLVLEKQGYWDGYDPNINPNIIDAFSAAAFRFGHSLLPTAVERWSKAHKFIASKRLSDLIRRPYDLYRAGVMDEYLMGLMNQVAQAMDDSITQEVTNHLLKKPGHHFGLDLVAFNMQRGREFGVPGYMYFRKFCGLPVHEEFEELFGDMPNSTVHRYQSIFQSTWDVDLWSGGVSEKPLPGSLIGSTFACIIATQMSYVRRGDRFWYELPNQPSSFTPEQLEEIKKIKLSRVLCDNTDLIDTIQVYPMVLPDYEINPRVPCKSGVLPSIDLSKWAEYDPAGAIDLAPANEEEIDFGDEGSGANGIGSDSHSGTTEDYNSPVKYHIDDEYFEGAGHGEALPEDGDDTSDHSFVNREPGKPPRYTNQNPVPLNATEPMLSVGNMTKVVALKTFNNTKVYIPVVVPQRHTHIKTNKTLTINSDKQSPEVPNGSVSSLVKATPMLKVKNDSVKPLKYDENFTILVAKRNKTELELKRNATKAHRRRRRAPYSYKDSSEDDIGYGSADSMEFDDESGGIQDADHDYDNDYEYVKPGPGADEYQPSGDGNESYEGDTSGEIGESGPSAPDAYDIHGYRGEQHTTRWPPNSPKQPAYALSEGQTPAPHMKSGRPQTFKPQLKDYGGGHHRHPGGATSSSSFNMGYDEHHHHHFYDRLKETHENKPPYYKHTTKFLIPPEIYKKYPGKHKHFHHVKTPEGQKVIAESEEDDPNFDPNTLTEKDHEDAYKTYDEEEIAIDVNDDYSDNPRASPTPPPPPPPQRQTPYKLHNRPSNGFRSRPITTLKATMPKNRLHTKRNGHYNQKHMMKYKVPRRFPSGKMSSLQDFPSAAGIPGSANKAEVERIFEAVDEAMRSSGMKSSPSLTSPTGPTGPIGPSSMFMDFGNPKPAPFEQG